jgi:hypothetical protein
MRRRARRSAQPLGAHEVRASFVRRACDCRFSLRSDVCGPARRIVAASHRPIESTSDWLIFFRSWYPWLSAAHEDSIPSAARHRRRTSSFPRRSVLRPESPPRVRVPCCSKCRISRKCIRSVHSPLERLRCRDGTIVLSGCSWFLPCHTIVLVSLKAWCLAHLTNRWSGRVLNKVPSSYTGVRAAELNR